MSHCLHDDCICEVQDACAASTGVVDVLRCGYSRLANACFDLVGLHGVSTVLGSRVLVATFSQTLNAERTQTAQDVVH